MGYVDFFNNATGFDPYPYQRELAEGSDLPALLRIPTGAGKTEAAVLGWMYRYLKHEDEAVRSATPRRLVQCLPMRTLVEQTVDRVEEWLKNLGLTDTIGLVTLMGGEPRSQWYLQPEQPCVVIGTQDMLLSRALNRGYGNSPFMWPVEYGLLNNDCLWVMDEVQIMANGLPTSTQLAGLRDKLQTFGPTQNMWMSATTRPDWLDTVDHPGPAGSQILELTRNDLADRRLRVRHNAIKIVTEASVDGGNRYTRNIAQLIAERHVRGTLTLAIVNTVERAQAIYAFLNDTAQITLEAEKTLVHSRFREGDRSARNQQVTVAPDSDGPGLVVVATQAVEAGVDISARTLITELAPWPSMVQRFGRCNREGVYDKGDVFWINLEDRMCPPYELEDLAASRELIKPFEGKSVGPADLEKLGDVMGDISHVTVIRKRDVVGLFDTTPDLSGSYLDVSQYVRGTDERSVSVFWRTLPDDEPGEDEPKPGHSELVSVPLGGGRGGPKGIRDFLAEERRAWCWNFLDDQWSQVRAREIYPGMTLMLNAAHGGYSPETGWDPSVNSEVPVVDVNVNLGIEEGQSSDRSSTHQGKWVTLSDHSRHVEAEVESILNAVGEGIEDSTIQKAVKFAGLYHDAGKAHQVFQETLKSNLTEEEHRERDSIVWAKRGPSENGPRRGHGEDRRHFRHELGSALAVLAHANELDDRTRDLTAFLAASHHGKVRLGIRSLPGRTKAQRTGSNPDPDYLLGYHRSEPETLPPVDLGDGLIISETSLDMSIAQIGLNENARRSWLERSLGLLDRLGPFRLAYLEAIVRAADMRASKKEQEGLL